MRPIVAPVALTTALLLTSGRLWAQDYVPGTVPYETALEAVRLNNRNYGIIGALERGTLPALEDAKEGKWVLFMEHNHLWNAVRVPAVDMSGATPWPVRMAKLDLVGTSVSLGYSFSEYFKAYAGWGMSGTQSMVRLFDPFFAPITNAALGWALPFAGNKWNQTVQESTSLGEYDKLGRSSWMANHNWVIGAIGSFGPLNVRVGYLGSAGLYAGTNLPDLGAFVQSAITDKFTQLSYIRMGFDGVMPEEEALSFLRASVRKLDWNITPPPPNNFVDEVPREDIKRAAFWTGHVEVRNLFSLIDLGSAMSFKPVTDLHEAHITVHNEDSGHKKKRGHTRADDEGKASLTAGVVKLPNLYFYGVEGGTKLMLSAQITSPYGAVILRMNDPEVLSVFPMAYDAVNLYFQLGGVANE